MDTRTEALAAECKRQEDSGLYTSTTLYVWLRASRMYKRVFIVSPIVLGAIVASPLLEDYDVVRAILIMVASLFPAIFEALKLDVHLETIAKQAAIFKSLQDRFRVARTVTALGGYEQLRAEYEELMTRMDAAREISVTPPEWCFKAAQKKVASGDYDFEVDDAPRNPGA